MCFWKAKNLIHFTVGVLLFGLTVFRAQAGFTSLYIFGDGASTTTNYGVAPTNLYYGKRNSNGRVWVEVLAQRQGLGANSITNVSWSNSSNNWSYYGQYSSILDKSYRLPRATGCGHRTVCCMGQRR